MGATEGRQIQDAFREAMRHTAQSVAIITASTGGSQWGITVTSYAALSIDPPLFLVCIGRASGVHDILMRSERFVVNILAEDQASESDRGAGRNGIKEEEKFSQISFDESDAGPLIRGSIAWLKCSRWATFEGGDHTILVGRVFDAKTNRQAPPLIYYDRSYTSLPQR